MTLSPPNLTLDIPANDTLGVLTGTAPVGHNGVDGQATQTARRNDRWDDRRRYRKSSPTELHFRCPNRPCTRRPLVI